MGWLPWVIPIARSTPASPIFLGTLALGPAAIVYMGVTAAVAAGAGAAEQAVTDTFSGRGFSYPARIDLR